jgi:hypothetical protein
MGGEEMAQNYNPDIINTCKQLQSEAQAIIDYTEGIQSAESENLRAVFIDNRMDELPHVQDLTVALTALMNGEEPTAAEKMDDTDDDEGGDTDDDDGT